MKKTLIAWASVFIIFSAFAVQAQAMGGRPQEEPVQEEESASGDTASQLSFEERLERQEPAALFELSNILRMDGKIEDANTLLVHLAYQNYLPALELMDKYIQAKESRLSVKTIGEREAWLIIAKEAGSETAAKKLAEMSFTDKKQQNIDLALKQIRYFMAKGHAPEGYQY